MEFDFKVRHLKFKDRKDLLIKNSVGVVKCKKAFPIYDIDGKDELFKPLSKTKPWTTPFFAISEVFWSTVINKFFDKNAPVYKLAECSGYCKEYPSRFSRGVLVPSIVHDGEKLVNLLEYYRAHPNKDVDINNYVNYCGTYYDYSMILNSEPFKSNPALAKALSYQILLSILKVDFNYHYENVAFLEKKDKSISLAPPIDHEFSLPFLFPEKKTKSNGYLGQFNKTLITNEAPFFQEFDITKRISILYNLEYIKEKYPDVVADFVLRLRRFIRDFSKSPFVIPSDYTRACSSDLHIRYEAIFHEHEDIPVPDVIPKIPLKKLDSDISERVKEKVLRSANALVSNLKRKKD